MRQWLKDIRLEKAYTQEDVSKKCGISRAFYSEIENETKNPSISTAKNIAKTLGFEWTYFFDKKCC